MRICVFISSAICETKGLCPILNKNLSYAVAPPLCRPVCVPGMDSVDTTRGHLFFFFGRCIFRVVHIPRMPSKSYHWRFVSLLCSCDVFRAPVISLRFIDSFTFCVQRLGLERDTANRCCLTSYLTFVLQILYVSAVVSTCLRLGISPVRIDAVWCHVLPPSCCRFPTCQQ